MSVLGEAPLGHNLGAHHQHNNHDDSSSQDGEGVWSPDIEQAFQEALIIYPTCGRRKHIIQEDNNASKMYGRNELIARHIKMRTGKTRSRKQVSSHIQVLARRKAKQQQQPGEQNGNSLPTSTNNRPHHLYNHHRASTSSGTPSPSSISGGRTSSQSSSVQSLVSVSNGGSLIGAVHMQPMMTAASLCQSSLMAPANFKHHHHHLHHHQEELNASWPTVYYDVWLDRSVVTPKIRLVEFSAFIEHRNPTTASANQQPVVGASDELNLLQPPHEHFTQQPPPPVQQHQLVPYSHQHHHLHNQVNNQYTASFASGTTNILLQQQLQQPIEDVKPNLGSSAAPATNPSNSSTATSSNNININNTNITQRHCYVQIDYTLNKTAKKLESIDISQIQDKFPEIGGPDGLFQRGPSDAFFLVKFWADINNDFEYNIDDQNSYFGFSSHFETIEHYNDITCSTKACSYGSQVVEKVDKIYGQFNSSNGRYAYNINRSQMCAFMIHFIKKLRQLPRITQMNSVLENFTVLQVITSESSSNEILLCLAYVFEVAQVDDHYNQSVGGGPTPPTSTTTASAKPSYHVYKLTRD